VPEDVSGPARYVSGGAARIRVVVPASVPLAEATVTVDGTDVTSSFAPDDQAAHALEGVLTDLPLGDSTVNATVPGPGHSANNRATLTLVNHPITGPIFSGPKQPNFFCSTAAHRAGFDLTGPFLDDDCSLATRTSYESRYPYGLGQGYAIAWSTGTKTNTHYNLVLGGETALMVKSRFVTEYDDPVHVGDCELLERWMDLKVRPTRRRRCSTPTSESCPGSPPEQQAQIEWTHWDDAVNVYGRDPATGFARRTWDNVGVQYGLQALLDGHITAAEFLDLNATVGGWKPSQDNVQEGCPFITTACPSDIEVWSARNIIPVGPDGVAPRSEGSVEAMRAAYRSGLVFDGEIGIPIIDWRHYLDAELDMHNARQSFAAPATHARADGRRIQSGDLVHRRAPRARLRPDADGARRDGRVAREPARAPGARRGRRQARSGSPSTARRAPSPALPSTRSTTSASSSPSTRRSPAASTARGSRAGPNWLA
jgi:hypothetical protein